VSVPRIKRVSIVGHLPANANGIGSIPSCKLLEFARIRFGEEIYVCRDDNLTRFDIKALHNVMFVRQVWSPQQLGTPLQFPLPLHVVWSVAAASREEESPRQLTAMMTMSKHLPRGR